MAFDLYAPVFDESGDYNEEAAIRYRKQLVTLFADSPEGKALTDAGLDLGWADMMIEFGIGYLGVTPAEMTAADLREVLLDLFPRKVSAEPDEAPEIVRELQAFWDFTQREFGLDSAAACHQVLNDEAVRKLEEAMGDPANFGVAKSFVMMGKERGFDIASEEGLRAWMAVYNAELAAGIGAPVPLPGEQSSSAREVHTRLKRDLRKERKKKRKMQKASRKQSRKKR